MRVVWQRQAFVQNFLYVCHFIKVFDVCEDLPVYQHDEVNSFTHSSSWGCGDPDDDDDSASGGKAVIRRCRAIGMNE